MDGPAGEAEEEKGIDRAKGQLALFGPLSGLRQVVQQPGQFGGREIRIEQQAGLLPDQLLDASLPQAAALINRPAILPDDGRVKGFAAGPVPQYRRLPLVGQADGLNLLRPQAGPAQGLLADGHRVRPDDLGVLFHPAVGWIELGQLLLSLGQGPPLAVKDDGPAGGGALVNGQDVLGGHGVCFWGNPFCRKGSPRPPPKDLYLGWARLLA